MNKRIISLLLAMVMLLGLAACGSSAPAATEAATADVAMQYITPEDAKEKLEDSGYVFFDLRKTEDSSKTTVPGAQAWDMDAAKEGDAEAGKATMTKATQGLDKNIILVCYSGKRYAQAATNALSAIGYDMSKVYTLEGGFKAWSEKFPELVVAPEAAAETAEAAKPQLSGTMKVVATSDKYVTLFDKFTADTGVKVELLSMSSGEVLSKLRAEGGVPSADLWFGGGIDAFMSAKADGLLEQVNFDAASQLAPLYKDEENYWFSKGMTVVGFLVNNSLLKELNLEAPTTWTDLVKPEYEGEVIMSNPAVSYIDKGVEKAIADVDVDIVYPADGMPWVPEGVAVFKNSENVEAAKYFVEWLFSNDEHLKELAELDGKDYIKLIKPDMEGIELTFDASIMMDEDLSLFGAQREEVLAKFETVMGEKSNTND